MRRSVTACLEGDKVKIVHSSKNYNVIHNKWNTIFQVFPTAKKDRNDDKYQKKCFSIHSCTPLFLFYQHR